MRIGRLMWRIYFYFLVSALAALAATAFYAFRSMKQFHEGQIAEDLLVRAELLAEEPELKDPAAPAGAVDKLCKDLGKKTGTRITVILPDGRVVGDIRKIPV